jgi:hypothetical protein
MRARLFLVVVAAGGCAHRPPPPVAAPAPTTLPACEQLLAQHQLEPAQKCLAALPPEVSAKPAAVYLRATACLYREDYAGATRAFDGLIAQTRAQPTPDRSKEAWTHNALTWVRWGAGDLQGAIAENEQVAQTLVNAPVSDEKKRGILLHYWWDRAYLLLDLSLKDASAAARADQARRSYELLARQPDEHDGLAVLAAYFAWRRHDGAAALAAARQVDPAKDDDVQDLYILALALQAGGDADGAAAIRERIAAAAEYPMKPLILHELAREARAGH